MLLPWASLCTEEVFFVSADLILQLTFMLPCVFVFALCLKIFPRGILALKYLKCWLQSQWSCARCSSEDKWGSSPQRMKLEAINLNRMQCISGRPGVDMVKKAESLTLKQNQAVLTYSVVTVVGHCLSGTPGLPPAVQRVGSPLAPGFLQASRQGCWVGAEP